MDKKNHRKNDLTQFAYSNTQNFVYLPFFVYNFAKENCASIPIIKFFKNLDQYLN